MSVIVLLTGLRQNPSKLVRCDINWESNLTAKQVIEKAFGNLLSAEIENDLRINNSKLMIAWYNKASGDVSEIGGVGNLNWKVSDNIVITINYESDSTTDDQIEESIKWTLSQDI
jgi:hypothetical protein